MRFTEHELTAALEGAAKTVLAAQRGRRRRALDVEEQWSQMDRFQRFQVLDRLGDQILPVLIALPDVEVVPGTRPSYTEREVAAVVTERLGESGGRLRRAVVVKTRTALVLAALAAVPPRLDPDALILDQ